MLNVKKRENGNKNTDKQVDKSLWSVKRKKERSRQRQIRGEKIIKIKRIKRRPNFVNENVKGSKLDTRRRSPNENGNKLLADAEDVKYCRTF